jgi:hypothetical protein
MGMIEFLKNVDLKVELSNVLDLLLVDGLACSVLFGNPVSALGDDSERTRTQLLLSELVDVFKFGFILSNECLLFDNDIFHLKL